VGVSSGLEQFFVFGAGGFGQSAFRDPAIGAGCDIALTMRFPHADRIRQGSARL
jgi:hypothetical protein